MSWHPIDLRSIEDRAPVEPKLAGIIYPTGTRHLFSGEPESGKTLAAFALGLEEIRGGGRVLHLDFEMFARRTRERLLEMGTTDDELGQWLHVEPDSPPTETDLAALVALAPTLTIIDAAAGAYAAFGLDDNARKDVERYARQLIDPLARDGISTITIDHVAKNRDTRGRFAIGSERKVGGVDVHLSFEAVRPIRRGSDGLVRITTAKDRFGYLPRPHACDLELHSDVDTHAITWTFAPTVDPVDSNGWAPTFLIERVSTFLAAQTEPLTRTDVQHAIKGKREYVLQAIDQLVANGCASSTPGPRQAKLITHVQTFRVPESFPDVPGTAQSDVPVVPPPLGGNGNDSERTERLDLALETHRAGAR